MINKTASRVSITMGYCFGYILGMHSKKWIDLPVSIAISLAFSLILFLCVKLFTSTMKAWKINQN